MVTCDDFDDFLRKELSEKIPNYIKDLEDSKQDLLRNECAIIVTGTSVKNAPFIECIHVCSFFM